MIRFRPDYFDVVLIRDNEKLSNSEISFLRDLILLYENSSYQLDTGVNRFTVWTNSKNIYVYGPRDVFSECKNLEEVINTFIKLNS